MVIKKNKKKIQKKNKKILKYKAADQHRTSNRRSETKRCNTSEPKNLFSRPAQSQDPEKVRPKCGYVWANKIVLCTNHSVTELCEVMSEALEQYRQKGGKTMPVPLQTVCILINS